MADASDVSNTLLALVSQALYPNGIAGGCVADVKTLVYVGWPDANTLDKDMQGLNAGNAQSRVHVSIYPLPGSRRTTKYRNTYDTVQSNSPATLTLNASANTVTVSGTVSTPQNIGITYEGGHGVVPITYAVQPSDTLTSIATAIAALIPGATSSGAVVTLPATDSVLRATVGGSAVLVAELRRQERKWQVSVWANNDHNRNAVGEVIDGLMASIDFIALPDTMTGRVLYVTDTFNDQRSPVQLYRRDFIYSVEYATTAVTNATQIVMTQTNTSTGVTGVNASLATTTVYQ